MTAAHRGGGGGSGRAPGGLRAARSGQAPLLAAVGVVAVGVIGVVALRVRVQVELPSTNPGAAGVAVDGRATPSSQACVKQLGTYCHIEAATDDPTPLTAAELYPPRVHRRDRQDLLPTRRDQAGQDVRERGDRVVPGFGAQDL